MAEYVLFFQEGAVFTTATEEEIINLCREFPEIAERHPFIKVPVENPTPARFKWPNYGEKTYAVLVKIREGNYKTSEITWSMRKRYLSRTDRGSYELNDKGREYLERREKWSNSHQLKKLGNIIKEQGPIDANALARMVPEYSKSQIYHITRVLKEKGLIRIEKVTSASCGRSRPPHKRNVYVWEGW